MFEHQNLLIFILLFFSQNLQSQSPDFSAGVSLGGINYQGDLVESRLFKIKETNLSGGVFLRKNFKYGIAGRFNLAFGKISGTDLNSSDSGKNMRGYNFTSPIVETALIAELELPTGEFEPILKPYLLLGIGNTYYNPTVDFNENTSESVMLDQEALENARNTFTIPLGFGLRHEISEKYYLEFETAYRVTFSDYLDGVSESGNPNRNDWWMAFGFNAGYRFALLKDTDGDGVRDKIDRCPRVPGQKLTDGCPDSDGDGTIDKRDRCPEVPGPKDLKGCPDSDGDTIIDIEDKCPFLVGAKALDGCPDADGDGIVDMEDQCPNAAGSRAMSGCPDTDGDGIIDPNDNCPNKKGTVENNGCPKN